VILYEGRCRLGSYCEEDIVLEVERPFCYSCRVSSDVSLEVSSLEGSLGMTLIVEDKSESTELISYSSTPLASSSESGNSISCRGFFILSARTVLRLSK
jgi:hypothetical protein